MRWPANWPTNWPTNWNVRRKLQGIALVTCCASVLAAFAVLALFVFFVGSNPADWLDPRARLIAFAEAIGLALPFSLAIAHLLASRLLRTATAPLRELATVAALASQSENSTARVTRRADDEIGALCGQFNALLDKIQQRDFALQEARDELECRVLERTAYLHALIENCPLAMLVLDTQQAVQLCNPAFERLFQYSRRVVLGKSATLLFPEDYLPEAHPAFGAAVVPITETTQRRRKDGRLVDVDLHTVGLTLNGKPAGSLAIYRDVSANRQAEESLQRAKDAAESANRAKGEFLANISHELRTPMNGIMGMTELVLDTELNADQRNYLTVAKTSADSLLTLINDILDYSKIEAGKLEIDAVDFNLRACVGATMNTLGVRAKQKNLELNFDIQPNIPDALTGDPGRLRQILVNLVGNAIKFTEKGEVTLRIHTEVEGNNSALLQFTVTDTGIGIAPEKQAAIFQPFHQADGSMTRKYGGAGLGLTIASRLVELMGGRIWVESGEQAGSQFHFTARFALQKSSAKTPLPRDPIILRGMRVLIVDDSAKNRKVLQKMLERWHMAPTPAGSGSEALAALGEAAIRGVAFPLILLDAPMPEMDGFTLAAAIKRNPSCANSTVMMLSSAGQRGDAMRCRELGLAAYLTKPVRQAELLDAVLMALGNSESETNSRSLVTRHSLRESRNQLRILLAEDNPVNQLVSVRLLEKYGHSVTVAVNGKQALDELQSKSFDVVLMDVQMPEMNGWEATHAIREQESGTDRHIPIVAMTAHAMKGDEERCLTAGMDAYVTKPLQTQKLLAVLDQIGSRQQIANDDNKPAGRSMDIDAALQRFEGDRDLFEQVARLFWEESPQLLEQLRSAVAAADASAVERHAHTLKGGSASLSALGVSQTAAELEMTARSQDFGGITAHMKHLESEMELLFTELEALCAR